MRGKGFLSLEYAVLIVIAIAALMAMSTYFKRAICGKWRQAADTFGHGRQYAPSVIIPGE